MTTRAKVSVSQMTTRKRNNTRDKQVNDSEEEGVSAVEYDENEVDDDDDVSQILMPNGNQKREKNDFLNEYDEACAKLQLNSMPSELPCRDAEIK